MAALADPLPRKLGAVDRREEVTDTYGEQRGHETWSPKKSKDSEEQIILWKYEARPPKESK